MQWNLTLQFLLAKDTDLRVGYVGSRGIHQPFRVEDADIVLPTLTPQVTSGPRHRRWRQAKQ